MINESQARGGQIVIKIPSNSQASLSRSLASEPPKMIQGYVQGGQTRFVGAQQVIQVQRHSQHMVPQQIAPQQYYHSQGMVPQQIVRVSPGGSMIPPSVSPIHRPPQY